MHQLHFMHNEDDTRYTKANVPTANCQLNVQHSRGFTCVKCALPLDGDDELVTCSSWSLLYIRYDELTPKV